MLFLNEYEIDMYSVRFTDEQPNLQYAALALKNLMEWTNSNSDGWAYWRKPLMAARKVMTLLDDSDWSDSNDVSDGELKAALTPIKSFLTRHGVNWKEVLS